MGVQRALRSVVVCATSKAAFRHCEERFETEKHNAFLARALLEVQALLRKLQLRISLHSTGISRSVPLMFVHALFEYI